MVTCRLCLAGIRMKKTKEVDRVTLPGERVCIDQEACADRRQLRIEREQASRRYYLDDDPRMTLDY
jgi:hypothetical protein